MEEAERGLTDPLPNLHLSLAILTKGFRKLLGLVQTMTNPRTQNHLCGTEVIGEGNLLCF